MKNHNNVKIVINWSNTKPTKDQEDVKLMKNQKDVIPMKDQENGLGVHPLIKEFTQITDRNP